MWALQSRISALWTPWKAKVMSSHTFLKILIYYFMIQAVIDRSSCEVDNQRKLNISLKDLDLLVHGTQMFQLTQYGDFDRPLNVEVITTHKGVVEIVPNSINTTVSHETNGSISYDICAYAKSPGTTDVTFNVTPDGYVDMNQVFLRVTVMQSTEILVLSQIIGWIYFLAWSVSFYPQIWTNFRRKSVVGLNFDFISLNLVGFTLYSVFNCAMFFSKEIEAEYLKLHPRGVNPVKLNDVFFSLHAAFATIITIIQCSMYERDEQRVSITARSVLAAIGIIVIVCAILAGTQVIMWLNFINYCSYIKLFITFVKYLPQAYMNYKRKSTVGWSIGNIFLDFTGGSFSILQMLLDAYNYDDWHSLFGDLTKFGLGMFSLIFDIFFMLQHYVFYRQSRYEIIVDADDRRDISNHLADVEQDSSYQNYPTPTT